MVISMPKSNKSALKVHKNLFIFLHQLYAMNLIQLFVIYHFLFFPFTLFIRPSKYFYRLIRYSSINEVNKPCKIGYNINENPINNTYNEAYENAVLVPPKCSIFMSLYP